MMKAVPTTLFGIFVPSNEPLFLWIVGFHIALGVLCVVAGAVAMLGKKVRGTHSLFGSIYFWTLNVLFCSATILAFMRWQENKYLFFIGLFSVFSALVGRNAIRGKWTNHLKFHIPGFGISYVLMLIAFYVDNGKHLPIWMDINPIFYWALPTIVGVPIIVWAMSKHKAL